MGTRSRVKLLKNVAVWSILAPFFAIALGWIFTEMGRQPFVVVPNLEGVPQSASVYRSSYLPGVSVRNPLLPAHPGPAHGVLMVVGLPIIKYVKAGVVVQCPS